MRSIEAGPALASLPRERLKPRHSRQNQRPLPSSKRRAKIFAWRCVPTNYLWLKNRSSRVRVLRSGKSSLSPTDQRAPKN